MEYTFDDSWNKKMTKEELQELKYRVNYDKYELPNLYQRIAFGPSKFLKTSQEVKKYIEDTTDRLKPENSVALFEITDLSRDEYWKNLLKEK